MKSKLVPVKSPVTEALILICEKCGKKLAKDPDKNPARELQQYLKETIKANDQKGKLRAVVSTCLDVCPKDLITVGVSLSSPQGAADRFFVMQPEDVESDARAVLEQVKSLL